MRKKLGVLVIHGMGSQPSGYSLPMKNGISARLGEDADNIAWSEVHWAPVLQERQDDLWGAMTSATDQNGALLPMDFQKLRSFVLHTFGDAMAYSKYSREPDNVYRLIHTEVGKKARLLIEQLESLDSPIVVIAHSLGCHIMSNYLWDSMKVDLERDPSDIPISSLVGFITIGCNIPLFGLAFSPANPIIIPGAGIDNPALIQRSKWLNYYDRDDVLGWPVKPLYAKDIALLSDPEKSTVARIEDHEINVGSMISSWNPVSHTEYWTDNDFIAPVGDYLEELLDVIE